MNEETFQKVASYALTGLLAAFLIVAWLVTAPLFRWSVLLSDFYRNRFPPETK